MARPGPETVDKEGIVDRKLTFCPRLQEWNYGRLIHVCSCCSNYMVHCCGCDMREASKVDQVGLNGEQAQAVWDLAVENRVANNTTCHHFRLILVSGLTINGGKKNAAAGLGFAFGKRDECQGSLVVDEEIDPSKAPVTLQRAEILAATEGLLALSCWEAAHEKKARRSKGRGSDVEDKAWVIGTDSKYLMKAMTEDLPRWKNSSRKKGEGTEPANLDLLQILHAVISAEESKQRVKIGLWRIPKARNAEATGLARAAVRSKFTPTELAMIAKSLRAEKEMTNSDAVPSEPNDVEDRKAVRGLKTTSSIVEKQAPRQETKAKGKTDNIQAAETGPVSLSIFSQGPTVLMGIAGSRGAHGEAPAYDRLSPVLGIDDDLIEFPWVSAKSIWWAEAVCDAVANLLLHQCIQHAEEWTSAYVYLLLVLSSEEWRLVSLFVVGCCVYIVLMPICWAVGLANLRSAGFEMS